MSRDSAEFDPATRIVRRADGRSAVLSPQAAKVLHLLLTRSPEVVTRAELKALLWPHRPYGQHDNGVNFCIRMLRRALEEELELFPVVQTVRGRGYRVVDGPAVCSSSVSGARRPCPELLEVLADPVVVVDEGGAVLCLNAAAMTLSTSACPHSLVDVVGIEAAAELEPLLEQCGSRAEASILARIDVITRHGRRPFDVRLQAHVERSLEGILLLFRDLGAVRSSAEIVRFVTRSRAHAT